MKRGEIWTVSGGGYAGKPRPALIVQNDELDYLGSVTVCPITTHDRYLPSVRVDIQPLAETGLRQTSSVTADKITTIQKSKFGRRIGVLSADDMKRVEGALLAFLGIADHT